MKYEFTARGNSHAELIENVTEWLTDVAGGVPEIVRKPQKAKMSPDEKIEESAAAAAAVLHVYRRNPGISRTDLASEVADMLSPDFAPLLSRRKFGPFVRSMVKLDYLRTSGTNSPHTLTEKGQAFLDEHRDLISSTYGYVEPEDEADETTEVEETEETEEPAVEEKNSEVERLRAMDTAEFMGCIRQAITDEATGKPNLKLVNAVTAWLKDSAGGADLGSLNGDQRAALYAKLQAGFDE